ncbi:TPR-like protein [Coemansia reversa NRRL 1564]|uniref:TPR-like protein n=1 Tax=Coemansia reversa (strain ATCC 12441 / NRRL 1564) TaxID=763665 RepID=A0A2G5BB13_COERN|nr:TPR-like protein [Coemansia reversa NRRL 1564]|eukprot:PIA16182.1 TPR-like protein [Coemansia reversa NRRL 1564]
MDVDTAQIRSKLQEAVEECTTRGLLFAAKWAAEQLCSLSINKTSSTELPVPLSLSSLSREEEKQFNNDSEQKSSERLAKWSMQDTQERDRVVLAKCMFDLREFDRAAFCLEKCMGPRAMFLRLYSRFLSRERRAGEARATSAGNEGGNGVDNSGAGGVAAISAEESERRRAAGEADRELLAIRDELEAADAADNIDAFGLYLAGLVYRALGQRNQAQAVCLRSVRQYEYNWSAWQLLGTCIDLVHYPIEQLTVDLSGLGWMRHAFLAHALVERFGGNEGFTVHQRVIEQLFPQSPFVLGLVAMRHYSMREFEEAGRIFGKLDEIDPYGLELSDIYSNILFVMEDRARLGALAHKCAALDRFRPETCCVIGNYYSLRREHEKAVGYFQRALQLDKKYLAAWTLMGHEFIELKNTTAAIDAYRHAVDVDDRDYRAWYGLGQTYEILKMPHYASNYFMRAATLRPYDSRMWCALGHCYESTDQPIKAIESYRRALLGSAESEALAVTRLAKLYDNAGENNKAAYYYQLLIEHAIKNGGALGDMGVTSANTPALGNSGQQDELAAACLFLAGFEHDRGNVQAAMKYLSQVVDGANSGGASQQRVEEARAIMRAFSQH